MGLYYSYSENKDADQLRIAQLICAFVFAYVKICLLKMRLILLFLSSFFTINQLKGTIYIMTLRLYANLIDINKNVLAKILSDKKYT